MNSISRSDHPCHKSDKSCPTIIKCGCSNSTTIPAGVTATDFTVSSLALNTSHLDNPCVKLEFASNIVALAALVVAVDTLTFRVFKTCPNQITPTPIGPSWTFSETLAIGSSATFSFFVCDCDSCFNDCCTYTVVVSATTVAGIAAINNATLGAIATCCTSHCC